MIYGIKKIKIVTEIDSKGSEKIDSVMYKNSGDQIVERIGDFTVLLKKNNKSKYTVEDINKINNNIDLFCEEKGVSKIEIFNNGEKHPIYNSIDFFSKKAPLDKISVIIKNESTVSEITNLCSIDMVSGKITIPNNIDGIISLVYIEKGITVINKDKNTKIAEVGLTIFR